MHASHKLALGFTALLISGGAQAQGNPSADQIIRGLQPGSGMMGTTRGIRPVAPAAEPQAVPGAIPRTPATQSSQPTQPPADSPAASPAASRVAPAPSVNLTVQFATNSADLTPAATRTLDELGRALSSPALAAYRFRIEGHTDTTGSADMNRALSERRAAAVLDYLVAKFSVERTRIETVGMGQDGLLVQTPPQTSEPRNRRVQVVNLGA